MENISKVLESGSNEEKIKILESLENIDNPEFLEKIILKLDDEDIQVRGEAFSALVLNKNEISNLLIKSLKSTNKNIRGFVALVLANRNETSSVLEIIKLVKDERSMVRSCAIGALGHLKDQEAKEVIEQSVFDSNLEVKKSALQAVIDLNITISEDKINKINIDDDTEIEKLLIELRK